jgi:glucuronosyltransferase
MLPSLSLSYFFPNFPHSYRKYFATPAIDKQMKEIFGKKTPYADDLDRMTSLMLVNSNPAVDYAESLPPNIIQVGGLQIKEPKAVPNDINQFIVRGKKGTVLMALGTNMRSDEIGQEAIHAVLEAFRQIPDFNFLWKFETSEMLGELPVNVMIRDWLPQNDILAHPHVKAFITHGGLLSTHETVWHGVPMVVIPFYADQNRNAFKSAAAGIAVKVDFQTITTEKLRKAIIEVLLDPKYRKNMQKKSKLFKDQPEKPLARAVWWCEYVIRNPQPTHLRQPTFTLGLLGSHFWDIQVIILMALIIVYHAIKGFYLAVRGSSRSQIVAGKKNN